nr:MAG: putative RNA dependent RNA polymerase [Guangdong mito-like virus 6]
MLFRMKKLYSWQRGAKALFCINKGLLQVLKLTWGGTTVTKVSSYYVLLISLTTLQKRSGLAYTCKYMKACSIYVMKYVAKDPNKLSTNSLDILVSITDSGIPRIIPSYFRLQLRKRNINTIRAVLTIFNLYRVLDYRGSLKLSTITDSSNYSLPSDFMSWLRIWLTSDFIRTPFKILTFMNPFLIQSSGPCSPKGMNNTAGWLLAIAKLKSQYSWDFFLSLLDPYSEGRWNKSPFKKFFENLEPNPSVDISLGKLSAKEEPGKVRIFAMVDAVTQWLLKPLHSAIFSFLRNFPYDGTFDQIGKLEDFLKSHSNSTFYSFDLSAATDRLPLAIQIEILTILVNSKFANAWGELLVGRIYTLSYKKKRYEVKYEVGQPMGALSSWGMLALTHHLVVQYAAYLAKGQYTLFRDYIVLGDDIVIADKAVAIVYHHLMTINLQVSINQSKGLLSPIGLEFAKRFYINGKDFSPLSLKEFSAIGGTFSSFMGLLRKLDISPYKLLQLMGKGSFSAGNNNSKLFLLAKTLGLSLRLFDPKDPLLFLKEFYPLLSESDLRDILISIIVKSSKLKQLVDLERSGPSGYSWLADDYIKLPQISYSRYLQASSFGDPQLFTTVKKGCTPESLSLINRIMIPIRSHIAPQYDLSLLPTSKLLEIFFLDVSSMASANGQSPLLKVKPRNSFLRNWESVFQSLTLLKEVSRHIDNYLDVTVDSGSKEIVEFLLSLNNKDSKAS